jgi:glucose/arabinose dehydrogenase
MKTARNLALFATLVTGLWFLLPEACAVNMPVSMFGWGNAPPANETLQRRLHLPPGFSIARYATGLPRARLLRITGNGDLLVSLPHSGRIVLLESDDNGDGHPDGRRDLLTGLNRPHGMDLRDGWLYVAETNAVGRVRFDAATRRITGEFERIIENLPGGGNHWSRSLRFGPDGLLYLTVGSSCNVCDEKNPLRAAMLRFRPDGSEAKVFATGLRNTVGFDWRPDTNELYGTDNGRDFLGDEAPPEELNRIEKGLSYGWPYAYGERVPDPDLGAGNAEKIQGSTPPVHVFAAHSAPLGITFLRGRGLPPAYHGAAMVALHGSWNRTKKRGYAVVSLHFGDDGTISEREFISGFEVDEDVIGRPVDIAEGADGAIYISDDFTGSIYRVTYGAAES